MIAYTYSTVFQGGLVQTVTSRRWGGELSALSLYWIEVLIDLYQEITTGGRRSADGHMSRWKTELASRVSAIDHAVPSAIEMENTARHSFRRDIAAAVYARCGRTSCSFVV
jgi:hypothetical protein